MAETLSTNALITFDRFEADMGEALGTFSAEDKDIAIRLINAASTRANTITRRKLASRSYTDVTLDANGGEVILLPQFPVTAFSEVRVDSARSFGTSTIISSSNYDYNEDTGELFVWTGFPRARRCVRVSYTGGYATVPDDLQHAIVEAVAYAWKQLATKKIGVQSITGDGITTQYPIDIPIPAMRVIESYRREYVA